MILIRILRNVDVFAKNFVISEEKSTVRVLFQDSKIPENQDANIFDQDHRGEWTQAGNSGIQTAIDKANHLYVDVRHPSDATHDSRVLVNLADMSHKKTAQLSLGDASAGLDVDEFVSKCISFMRHAPNNNAAASNGTQGRGRRGRHSGTQRDPDASDEDDAGEPMNWDWLGQFACFPSNARPAVQGWLLGPLSVQKRARQVTQRRAAEKIDLSKVVQPNELQQQDLGQQESANLTQICSEISKLLAKNQQKRSEKAEQKLSNTEGITPEQAQVIMDEFCIADDGGIPLFRFCINPDSFGQSVENLFYVSFLVRDGIVGVSTDSRDIPTLRKWFYPWLLLVGIANILIDAAKPYAPSEAQKQGIQKHQAIFSLDYDTWDDIIKVFNIKKSIIPHREETQEETGTSWHG